MIQRTHYVRCQTPRPIRWSMRDGKAEFVENEPVLNVSATDRYVPGPTRVQSGMKLRFKKLRSVTGNESGVAAITVAFFLVVLLGFAALAIDIGNVLVVRNELQNAADAAALSGAVYFWYNNTSGNPNWSAATTSGRTSRPTSSRRPRAGRSSGTSRGISK